MRIVVLAMPLIASLLCPCVGRAHRLDEYLEATMISVDSGRMHADIRLVPGIAVLPAVLGEIDIDDDGVISAVEQRAYADKVLRDLSFRIDGARFAPRLISFRFPSIDQMKEGLGEIHLALEADLPRGGPQRRLTFENHHQFVIGAYLVNCLAPGDPHIRIDAQRRNYTQSSYELDFTDTAGQGGPLLSGITGVTGMTAFLVLAGFTILFRRLRAGRILTESES